MAGSRIIRLDEVTPVDRGSGAMTYPLVGAGAQTLSPGVSAFDPGVVIPLHSHNVKEVVVVLAGEGECETKGQT